MLLRIAELNVHVTVSADQPALIIGLAPLQPYENVLADAAPESV